MLYGKELIVAVLRDIEQKRTVTPKNELVTIHYANDLHKPAPYEDVVRLLKKFENDEKILKVVKTPDDSEDHCWQLKIYKKFDNYYDKLRKTKEYQDYTGELLLIFMTKSIRSLGKNRNISGISYLTLKPLMKPTIRQLHLC